MSKNAQFAFNISPESEIFIVSLQYNNKLMCYERSRTYTPQ